MPAFEPNDRRPWHGAAGGRVHARRGPERHRAQPAGHPGQIAGKTGTAEVSGAPSHGWFVGYAPYGTAKKRIAFAILVEHAGYGGATAAPAAGEIVTAATEAGLIGK